MEEWVGEHKNDNLPQEVAQKYHKANTVIWTF